MQFNYQSSICVSGSIDRTCKIWDVASGQCMYTLRGHNDEILDVCYNATGSRLATASADGTSRVYNTMTGACQSILIGHDGEISKVAFNPQGGRVLTASSDKTARLWDVESGDCLQVRLFFSHADAWRRFWKDILTKFSVVLSIMEEIRSLLDPRTTRVVFGDVRFSLGLPFTLATLG